VKNANLYFGLELKYVRAEYNPLLKLSVNKPIYKPEQTKYLWIFNYKDIRQVEKIIGSIKIPGYRDRFQKKQLFLKEFKGKDFIDVSEYPTIYEITEHRKQDDFSVKIIKHNIPKQLVDDIWKNVISKQPLNKPIKTSTVAENICKLLMINRFDRPIGTFNFPLFFGSRKSYVLFFYFPIKIMSLQGKIKHHKSGFVERIV
jgi:hypothetical protein